MLNLNKFTKIFAFPRDVHLIIIITHLYDNSETFYICTIWIMSNVLVQLKDNTISWNNYSTINTTKLGQFAWKFHNKRVKLTQCLLDYIIYNSAVFLKQNDALDLLHICEWVCCIWRRQKKEERERDRIKAYNIPRNLEGKNSGCDHGTVGEKGRSGRQFPARRSGPLQCRIFRRRCGCTRDATLTRSHPTSRLPSRVLFQSLSSEL